MVPTGRHLAWLCDLAQSPLLLQPQSSRLYRGCGKGWTLAPRPCPRIFPQASNLLPVPFGCFGCEVSGCPRTPFPVSPALPGALALSPGPLPRPLTTPISASSLLSGSRLLLPPLSLDPCSSQTWFTFRWLQRYFRPSPSCPGPAGSLNPAGIPPPSRPPLSSFLPLYLGLLG